MHLMPSLVILPFINSFYFSQLRWDWTNKILIAWADNPKYKYALDVHAWGYCIFEDFPDAVLTDANRFLCSHQSTLANQSISGYCFDEDKDNVWLEGTGQMVVAFIKAKKESNAQKYLDEMKKNLVESSLFRGSFALPYTVNFGTSYGTDQLWTGVDTNPAVSSTAWYLLGKLRFNPLELGYKKDIPEKDKFWMN